MKFVMKPTIHEFKRAVVKLERFPDKLYDAVFEELVTGANKIKNWVLNEMYRGSKTGRKYRRRKGKGKKWHTASAPGEVPAVDTGELARAMDIDVRAKEIEVGTTGGAPYGPILEQGAPARNLQPRPFLEPALDAEFPGIEADVMDAVVKAADDAFKK